VISTCPYLLLRLFNFTIVSVAARCVARHR